MQSYAWPWMAGTILHATTPRLHLPRFKHCIRVGGKQRTVVRIPESKDFLLKMQQWMKTADNLFLWDKNIKLMICVPEFKTQNKDATHV